MPQPRIVLVTLAAFVCLSGVAKAADTKRDPLLGEVDDKIAFVQTFDHKVVGANVEIEAKIKFLKKGTYVVAGGYYKGKYMHEGALGKKYFETKTVKADAGDVLTVKLKAPMPPANKKVSVAVYKSEKDIRTKSGELVAELWGGSLTCRYFGKLASCPT